MITNPQSGTRVDEIAPSIYRISTPLPPASVPVPGGFSFNQFLVADDEPLLFHTGPRRVFPLTREAVAAVLPVESVRWIAFSHYEADECGALNEFLAAAPRATAACSFVAALTSVEDQAIRSPRPLRHGEELSIGKHRVRWYDAPHLPHAWECGYLFEATTATLLCGDLFTQAGAYGAPVTEDDILGPSEAMRAPMDYYSHTTRARPLLGKLASAKPRTLACMHGSSWAGDGEKLLLALADALERG